MTKPKAPPPPPQKAPAKPDTYRDAAYKSHGLQRHGYTKMNHKGTRG